MSTAWLRFAYACELLLAIIAIFTLWSQVGGQSHLDLMPWYAKLGLGGGLSIAAVGFTSAIVAHPRIINRRSALWTALIIVLVGAMAAVTYYYHLHEAVDEPESEDGTTAALQLLADC